MINVIWTGSVKDPSGYGFVTRQYLHNLDKHYKDKVNLRVIPRCFFNGPLLPVTETNPEIIEMFEKEYEYYHCFIQNLTPDTFTYDTTSGYHIAMTTFETSGLPQSWIMPMQAMDEIWTYTNFNKKTFIDAGITRPIHIIPHGVDTDKFNPDNPGFSKMKEVFKDKFVFGTVFDWTARKNPETMLRSYFRAFEGRDDVVLILKSYFQYPISKSIDYMMGAIQSIKNKLNQTHFPEVYVLSDILPDSQMPNFYSSLDAFVSCSSGEGWHCPSSEAMATGLPTIATGWSGNTDFMNIDNSYLVDFKLGEVPGQFSMAHRNYMGQNWAFPSEDSLIGIMKDVYTNREAAKQKGLVARSDMVDMWSWKHAVDKLHNRLNELFGE